MKLLFMSLLALTLSTACVKSKDKVSDAVSKGVESVEDTAKSVVEKTTKSIEKVNPLKENKKAMSESNTMKIKLKDGVVKIKLRPDLAPKHVERIKTLTEKGFYDGLKFHRVIDGFMAQTGDPQGTGAGGSDMPNLQSEFNDASFKRGTLGMARAQSPHSANSQFFIMFKEAPHLNGQYTVFGEVTEGMEFVDMIKKGPAHLNGTVDGPDVMEKVTIGD